jgi:hypothetical protein
VFVILAIVSPFVRGDVPDTDNAHAVRDFARFYGKSSHQDRALVAATLGLLGLFLFLWFLGGLWSILRQAAGATTAPTIIVAVGGAGFFVLGALSHIVGNIIGITLHYSDGYKLDPGLAVVLDELSTGTFLAAMIAIGAAIAAAGVVIQQTRALPVWLAWIGFLLALLALVLIPLLSFFAGLLLAFWVLVVSALMITGPERAAVGSPGITSASA